MKYEKLEMIWDIFSRKLNSTWYWLIVKNVKVTGVAILVLGLLAVAATGVYLVWFLKSAPVTAEMKPVERSLNTALIDDLELWIEQVDAERRQGVVLPSQPLFVADDLKLVSEEEPQP